MLLELALAAQVMRAPVALPPVIVAPTVTNRASDAIVANLLPDLIVSEVRVENDKMAHIRVTNQGTADAHGVFWVDMTAAINSRHGRTRPEMITDLATGESRWIERGFTYEDAGTVPGIDYNLPLTEANRFWITVDPGVSPQSATDYLLHGKSSCTADAGCIRELDERNNARSFGPDEIGHWPPG